MTEYIDSMPMNERDQLLADKGSDLARTLIAAIGSTTTDDIVDSRILCIGMGGALGSFLNGMPAKGRTEFIKNFFDATIQYADVPLLVTVKQ